MVKMQTLWNLLSCNVIVTPCSAVWSLRWYDGHYSFSEWEFLAKIPPMRKASVATVKHAICIFIKRAALIYSPTQFSYYLKHSCQASNGTPKERCNTHSHNDAKILEFLAALAVCSFSNGQDSLKECFEPVA